MEGEKKNNSALVSLVIFLVVVVLALGAYIVYDKVLSNNDTEITDNETNNTDANESQNTISESEALTIGDSLWKYAYATYWGTEPVWLSHAGPANQYGGRPVVCDTTVEQVKQKYSSDFKASGPDENTTYTLNTFVPQTACQGAGRGGLQTYKGTTLDVKEIQENKIVFTAKSEYCSSSFCEDSNVTVKEIEKDFVIVKQNDNWLISNFYLPC